MQANIYNDFASLANQLADASGEVLRSWFRKPVGVESKADTSPVTEADRAVESVIRARIEAVFPAHGIIGEEFGNLRGESEYQWVIDPIDGTRAFMSGFPTFTTLISLLHNGVPVVGVIDQPILRERWLGVAGNATACNVNSVRKIVKTRAENLSAQTLIGTTSAPYYFSVDEAMAFERVRKICSHTNIGGDAYGYAMLASGQFDLFVDVCLKPYDFCALVPVIEGAGGIITDWAGNPLTLASDGKVIASANRKTHDKALEALAGR